MNALSIHYKLTIYFANLLGIKYLLQNFTMEPSNSRIHFIFTSYFLDSLSLFANIPRIQYLFDNFTINPGSVSRIQYTFTFFFSNSLFFLIFSIFLENSLYIPFLFLEFNIFFCRFTENSIFVWQFQYELTVCSSNSLLIWRIYYEFFWCFVIHFVLIIFFANSIWPQYLSR